LNKFIGDIINIRFSPHNLQLENLDIFYSALKRINITEHDMPLGWNTGLLEFNLDKQDGYDAYIRDN